MPSLAEIGPVVLEKKMKMWKVYDNADDKDKDDGQRTAFGSGELKTQNITITTKYKRTMGLIAHLRNKSKSKITFE